MFNGINDESQQLWLKSLENQKSNNEALATNIIESASEFQTENKGFIGLNYVRPFFNNGDTDCAQAAIATLTTLYNLKVHPEIQRNVRDTHNGRMYPNNLDYVNAIFADYPNDGHFFGINWTWKEQIARGLTGYGLKNVTIGYAGAGGNGQDQWNEVYEWLRLGWPVVVLIDIDPIKHKWGYHYTVLHKFDGTHVYLTNMAGDEVVDWNTFMAAWHCHAAFWPNNFVLISATT